MKHCWSLLLSILLISLIACGGGSDGGDPPEEDLFGNLSITISGLPDGVDAGIVVTGGSSFSQTVNATATLSNLPIGTYVVTATQVSSDNDTYSPDVTSQNVIISDAQTTAVTLTYTQDTEPEPQQKNFPMGLALASPTETLSTDGTPLVKSFLSPAVLTWTTAYADAVAQINELLNGEVAVNEVFTPELFFNSGVNANCYGPSLMYQDHPDGALPNSGQLPGGDLMLWQETDASTGHTCAAAQLNARLSGIKNQSFGALMSLASMLYVADANSLTLPGVGDTLDLTTEMNAVGITGVTFTDASITLSSENSWYYTQAYTFDYNGTDRAITVEMYHNTSASEFEYDGIMQFTINGDNTIFGGGNCNETDRTLNGSMAYQRNSETDLRLQSRVGILCGANVSGFVTDNTQPDYRHLDPANRYDSMTNVNGWSENFNIFGAQMNPDTLQGTYAYIWQAGVGDSHSRTFLMGVNYNETGGTGPLDGEAYAGFGDQVHTTDGSIDGMICNWAGPNGNHTLQPYVQRQFFSLDPSTAIFNTPVGGSDITYAPTNNCAYDGSGSYIYDTDLDNDLSDETASGAITPDLMGAFDLDGDTVATVPEAIENRGYTLPEIPGGLPGS
jgi:hypothetical protein